MARLPTVKLQHRRNPDRKLIINFLEYQAEIGRYARDWKILSVRGGDADDREVRTAQREWKINTTRLTSPVEQKWRGDNQRKQDERTIHTNIVTEPREEPATVNAEAVEDSLAEAEVSIETPADDLRRAAANEDNWESIPWFTAKAFVLDQTGIRPRDKAHARELMEARAHPH